MVKKLKLKRKTFWVDPIKFKKLQIKLLKKDTKPSTWVRDMMDLELMSMSGVDKLIGKLQK